MIEYCSYEKGFSVLTLSINNVMILSLNGCKLAKSYLLIISKIKVKKNMLSALI